MYNQHEIMNKIADIPSFVVEKLNRELHKRGTFIHTVLNTVDALVVVADKEGRIVLFNKACEKLTGYSFNEVKGKTAWDLFFTSSEKEAVFQYVSDIFTKIKDFPDTHVNHWVSRNGDKFLISWSNSVLKDSKGSIQYMVSTGIDITEQEAAKAALVEREEKLRNLFDNAQDAIFLCKLTEAGTLGNYTNVNKVGCMKLGYTLEELKTMSPLTIGVLEEEARRPAVELFLKQKNLTFTMSLLTKDGRSVPFEFNAHMIQFNGKSLCLAIARDITERVRIERELRESEERSRLLVDLSPDAIFIHQDGKIVYANPATARIFRAENVSDMLGMEIISLVSTEYREVVLARFESIYRTGLPSPFMEQKYLRLDGSAIDVEVTGSLCTFQGKPAIQSYFRDITQRKKNEQDALTADKLQSVGNLAGTIAHEYNNLLTVILGNLSVARMYGKQGDKESEILVEAEKAAQQARELTQRLLTFARGGSPVKQLVNLRKVLFKCCSLHLSQNHIHCALNVPGDLLAVEADEGQVCQAISNIVINAVEAMPEGGTIDVTAENISPKHMTYPVLQEGMYVKITITDQGHGIPKDQLPNIFDPFYTTKPEGSGLGLPTAYSIIKKHDGFLTVESEADKGTTFVIYLPAVHSSAVDLDEPLELSGSGRILLMDDEQAVRQTGKEMLRLLGYEVTLAAEGYEALRLYSEAKESGKPFAFVILDLVVREGLGGKETLPALFALDSHVKALVSSGYSSDPVMSGYTKYGFCGCVPKPYTIEQMGQALRRVLQVT